MTDSSLSVTTHREPADREAIERGLATLGIKLPAMQSARWMRLQDGPQGMLLVARDGAGAPRRALGASISASRALPGHRIYRVERLGAGGSSREDVALLKAFADVVRRDFRCLRAVVEILERESGGRALLSETLRDLGFSRVSPPRMYARTIALDLVGTEDELFASIDKTARRHVRAPAKRGLELRQITDVRYAPRIEALLQQTFQRTEGDLQRLPWNRIIEWSVEEPRVSRVIVKYRPTPA